MKRRPILAALALLFVAFAAYGSFVPLRPRAVAWDEAVRQFAATPFIPLALASKTDFITNVLLFVPIGFFTLGAIANRSRRAAIGWAIPAILASVAVSVAIEFGQIFVRGRTPSWNDVFAETLGAVIGVATWVACGNAAIDWLAPVRHSTSAADRLFRLLGAYTLVWLVLALLPFDFTIRPQELAEKFRAGRIVLEPFGPRTPLQDVLTTLIMAMPVGACAVLGARQFGFSRFAGLIAGLAIALLVECAQLLAVSRTADVTDVLMNAAGVSTGVALAARWLDRSPAAAATDGVRLWPIAALAAWSVVLIGRHWSPFDFVADGAFIQSRIPVMMRVPFHSYYWAFALDAFAEAMTKVLLSIPVGALLQLIWWPKARTARHLQAAGIVLIAAAVFLVLELGQLMLPSRVPDQTDIYIGIAGASFGVWAVRVLRRVSESRPGGAASATPLLADSSRESATPPSLHRG